MKRPYFLLLLVLAWVALSLLTLRVLDVFDQRSRKHAPLSLPTETLKKRPVPAAGQDLGPRPVAPPLPGPAGDPLRKETTR